MLQSESSAMARPMSFPVVPNCFTPPQVPSQVGDGTGADPATHAPLDSTKPTSQSNPHALPSQVACACSGGAAHGVQDAPQLFKLVLLTHCPSQLCWPASQVGGGGGAPQMTWVRHSADPTSWLTTKRFSTTFWQTGAAPVAPPLNRSRHCCWLSTLTTTTCSALPSTASESPGPMRVPKVAFDASASRSGSETPVTTEVSAARLWTPMRNPIAAG